jgi:glutathione transport system substrate-binding protein
MIKAALETADENKRAEAYKEAQSLLWEDAAWVNLAAENTISGQKNYLKGIYLLPDGSLSVTDLEIVE